MNTIGETLESAHGCEAAFGSASEHAKAMLKSVAGTLVISISLLAITTMLPPLWAQHAPPTADLALEFVFRGLFFFAAVLLPEWALSWRTTSLHLAVAMVFILLGGFAQGATMEMIGRRLVFFAVAAGGLGVAWRIATMWARAAGSTIPTRIVWLLAVSDAVGVPVARYLMADSAS